MLDIQRRNFESIVRREVLDQNGFAGQECVAGLRPVPGWDGYLTGCHIHTPSSPSFDNQRLAGASLMENREKLDVESLCNQLSCQSKEAVSVRTAESRLCEVSDHDLRSRAT